MLNKYLLMLIIGVLINVRVLAQPIWTTSFGTQGQGDGRSISPYGIAVDDTGKIYVTYYQNSRVQIFNSDTTYNSKFGTRGQGDGQFRFPSGIAVDNKGKIYVTEQHNFRVQIFNSNNNTYNSQFGTRGEGNGQFITPSGIAIDNKGKIYVIDEHNSRVQIFNSNTTYNSQFGTKGRGDGQFSYPAGIAVDNTGKIYVTDHDTHRVQIFNSNNNTYNSQFGTEGRGDGQFITPSGIAIDNTGKIYVTDYSTHRVQIFNSNNTYNSKFGTQGKGDGQFEYPSGIAIDNTGKIYVTDIQADRVAVLFEPSLWSIAGTCTLGSLSLNQNLTLNQDYHLVIKPMDNNKEGVIVQSDGKLTVTDKAVLTANVGSSIEATSIVLDDATLILNTNSITGNIKYSANGILKINSNITNNIDFAGHNGVLQLADGQTIDGNVDSSTTSAGTLEFLGSGTVIGRIGETNALSSLKFSGAGITAIPKAIAKTIEVANKDARVTSTDLITSAVSFSSDGSLIASKGVTGSVTTSTDNTGTITIGDGNVGTIGAVDKKLKLVNLNHGSATTLGKLYATNVKIGGAGPITSTDLITSAVSFSSDGSLTASKGVTGSVTTSTDNTGTITIGDGNVGTIGAVDKKLKLVNLNHGSATTLGKLYATNVKIGGAGPITSTDLITSAVSFSSDGSLTASKGVTGSVTTSTDNTGTITIGDGNVGTIGAVDKKLKLVNLNHGSATTLGKLYATNVKIGGAGPITSTDLITSAVSFSSDGSLTASKGVTGSVTTSTDNTGTITIGDGNVGTIGAVDKKLKLVNLNHGSATTLGKLYATNVKIGGAGPITSTDLITSAVSFSSDGSLIASKGVKGNIDFAGHNGVLQLADGQTIDGNVDSSTTSAGTLEFLGSGTVTGRIGAINKLKLAGDLKSQAVKLNNAVLENSNSGTIEGPVEISNSTIDLGSNTLRLTGKLSNNITLKTKYDAYNLAGGNIIVPSTLDLSNVDQLLIKLSYMNSDISKIDDNTKYHLILTENGGNIIPLYDPEQKILLDSSGEQNRFVKWMLDTKSLTLYGFNDSNNVIDKDLVFDSQHKNKFMQALKSVLPNSDAQKLKNNLGLLNKEQVEEMLSKLLDHYTRPDTTIVQVALQQILTGTHNTAINTILNRLNNSILPVSAGNNVDNCINDIGTCVDGVNRYGVWAKTTINHRKDKVSDNQSEYFSSYKTRGYSNTIGFDTLISNDLLVGAAYTNTYTSIKPQNKNVSDIDKARTNVFSLYSSYHIPSYNLYINSTLSYGDSTIRERKIRNIALAKNILGTELAFGKYKSYLYSGSLSLGYYKHIKNDIYITPSLSVIGAVIRDKGYKEYGTSFQNITVGAKSYNKFSSVVGLRMLKNIYLGNTIVIPEVYGFVNYNIKNKSPAINARLTGLDDCLPKFNHRTSKLEYNLGLGILLKQNMMEYGINYNINIARKHTGHAGSLKLRANF